MKDNLFYLSHIDEAIDHINSFIGDADYAAFSSNRMMVNAVIKELEIIGEAANNVDKAFRNNHPEILWRKMIDMRNFLIHEYFGIRKKLIWDTCKSDLPELKNILNKIIKK